MLNHREFVLMVANFVLIGFFGALVDLALSMWMVGTRFRGVDFSLVLLVALHLAYSLAVLGKASAILWIHAGLICRNELAAEWRTSDFYIVRQSSRGENVAVRDLSDDEYNRLFDSFVYDSSRNPFDLGWPMNCFNFWCTSRWTRRQLGEF